MRYFPALWAVLVSLVLPLNAQRVALPPAAELTPDGLELILEFETGGRSGYVPQPIWPGFASGVTVGVGYDLGYNSRTVILGDWRGLSQVHRLAATSGITGIAAKSKAAELRDVIIAWQLATSVFTDVTVTRFFELCRRTFRGFEELHANCQAALVSLVFNRGNSMAGPRRVEMRAIRNLVPKRDYAGIAAQIRAMKKIWRGTDIQRGMERRREAEARLVETALLGR